MALNTKGKKSSLHEDALIYEKRGEDNISGRQRWKHLSSKERRTQFKDYYLQPLIIAFFVLCAAAFFIYHDFIARKDIVYQCAIINEIIQEDKINGFSSDFVSFAGYDKSREEATFGTYYIDSKLASQAEATVTTDIQHISARIYAASLDTIIAAPETLITYQQSGLFTDLSQFLSDDEQKKLNAFLYYPEDKASNPKNKPYGISLSSSPTYKALFTENEQHLQNPVLAILGNSEKKEETRKLLYYLFPDIFAD